MYVGGVAHQYTHFWGIMVIVHHSQIKTEMHCASVCRIGVRSGNIITGAQLCGLLQTISSEDDFNTDLRPCTSVLNALQSLSREYCPLCADSTGKISLGVPLHI